MRNDKTNHTTSKKAQAFLGEHILSSDKLQSLNMKRACVKSTKHLICSNLQWNVCDICKQ